MNERLYRSRRDRMLAGVAGGLAEQWRVDPSLVRVVWAVLVPLTGGIALLVYVIMAIVVPEEWDVRVGSVSPAPDGPRMPSGQAVGDTGRLLIGALLVLVGLYFLARQYLPRLDFDWFWPLILIGLGVVLLLTATGRWPNGPAGRR